MAGRITKEEQEIIRELRLQGYGPRVIGNKLGRGKKTIQRQFVTLGLPTNLKDAGIKQKFLRKVIECKFCGTNYETSDVKTKFCSDNCRGKHNKRTTLRTIRTCGHCGKKFKTYKSKYCSEECRYPNQSNQLHKIRNSRKMYYISCIGCNKRFITRRRRKYCNKECDYKCNYVSKAKTHSIKCTECGKHKEVSFKRKKFCSDTCSKKYANRENYLRRERLKRLNGKIHWDISIERLMKRDGKRCYLCGVKVDIKDISVIDNNMIHGDMYPSIDHVIPLAKEGTHTWDNVRLAHRLCNSIKSDKV